MSITVHNHDYWWDFPDYDYEEKVDDNGGDDFDDDVCANIDDESSDDDDNCNAKVIELGQELLKSIRREK